MDNEEIYIENEDNQNETPIINNNEEDDKFQNDIKIENDHNELEIKDGFAPEYEDSENDDDEPNNDFENKYNENEELENPEENINHDFFNINDQSKDDSYEVTKEKSTERRIGELKDISKIDGNFHNDNEDENSLLEDFSSKV